MVIDGFSVIAHGYLRATRDSDLLVPDGPEADAEILRFLERIEASRLHDGKRLASADIVGAPHLRVRSRHGIVDILRGGLPPLDYDTVAADAIELNRGGEPVPFASLRSLVAFKRLAGRGQDRVDLENLERINGELPVDRFPASIPDWTLAGGERDGSVYRRSVASWGEIERLAPDLARQARGLLDAHVHKTLATVRADGSPRISGIEAKFIDDDLWFGSMPGSRKGADLAHDPRFALHSGSIDPPGWEGDAKLAGLAEEVADRDRKAEVFKAMGAEEVPDDSSLYRADVREVAVTRLTEAKDELAIDFWTEAGGLRSLTRK
ncbi:MAG TPA: pyridoxamine 5'-phosphate oxidase family protein [Solirubrobacterales bacterium]